MHMILGESRPKFLRSYILVEDLHSQEQTHAHFIYPVNQPTMPVVSSCSANRRFLFFEQ